MATGWQAIETADATTKDGHDVLVALMPGGRRLVAHWEADLPPQGGWVAERQVFPTHWQELPDPPAAVDPEPVAKASKKAAKD